MTFLEDINVGGQQYKVNPSFPMGTCATPAGTEVKVCVFADNFTLSAGNLISVTFTYANTYGDGSTTYPKLSINGTQYPVKNPTGSYASSGAWANGQAVTFMCDGSSLVLTSMPVVNAVAAGSAFPVSAGAVADAIEALDAPSVGGTGKYISAISETDGVISATASDLATSVAIGNTNPVTSDAVYSALQKTMPLVKSVRGNYSVSLSIADLDLEGVYLVIATDLHYSWEDYNVGILLNHSEGRRDYINISHNNLNITVDGTNIKTITSGRFIWGAKFYKVGYY